MQSAYLRRILGAEMVFCCHCGKPAEGGRFCAACGRPIAPDAVAAVTVELQRHRTQMRLMVIALGVVSVVTAGLIVTWVMYTGRVVGRSLIGGETFFPTVRQQQPLPSQSTTAQTPPGQDNTPDTSTSQPQQQPPQVIVPSRPSTGSIDPKAVQNALTTLAPQGKQKDPQKDPSPQQPPAPTVVATDSDRYPGSQPVEVKNADLPDIGIPVAGEVYTTADSLSTVINYYTQRYPDAEVLEISGQKVIAVNRPGVTKVIAIGTTGEETRIAIVQPRH